MSKKVIFKTIQFSISTQFSSIWPIHRTLSGATTQGLSGPGSDGNEGVHCIPQTSSITGTSSSDCLVSYREHSLCMWVWGGGLPLCKEVVSVFRSRSWLGKTSLLNCFVFLFSSYLSDLFALFTSISIHVIYEILTVALSTSAVEYTDCISAEE